MPPSPIADDLAIADPARLHLAASVVRFVRVTFDSRHAGGARPFTRARWTLCDRPRCGRWGDDARRRPADGARAAAATEAPHHERTSFRVGGKIFATMPPDGATVNVLLDEEEARLCGRGVAGLGGAAVVGAPAVAASGWTLPDADGDTLGELLQDA